MRIKEPSHDSERSLSFWCQLLLTRAVSVRRDGQEAVRVPDADGKAGNSQSQIDRAEHGACPRGGRD